MEEEKPVIVSVKDKTIEIRTILIGKTGSGKSYTGNAILGVKLFTSGSNIMSLTAECSLQSAKRSDQNVIVKVIDTPGLIDTTRAAKDINKEVRKSLVYSSPGPHAFLFCIPMNKMTQADEDVGKLYQEIFGEQMVNYTILVFNRVAEWQSDRNIKITIKDGKTEDRDIAKDLPEKLRGFLEACNRRYFFLQSMADGDALIQMIKEMHGPEFFRGKLSERIDRVLEQAEDE